MSNSFKKDYTGYRFGKLTVTSFCPREGRKAYWLCACSCGNIVTTRVDGLTGNSTCGCEPFHPSSHGMSDTPEYMAWLNMKARCYNSGYKNYHRWGGRGITVCDRWRDSFVNFFEDMGLKPSTGHSMDRIDNDGNYVPDNCRWATRTEQDSNTSVNNLITANGVTKTATEWGFLLGVQGSTISRRIGRGWSPEKAVSQKSERG